MNTHMLRAVLHPIFLKHAFRLRIYHVILPKVSIQIFGLTNKKENRPVTMFTHVSGRPSTLFFLNTLLIRAFILLFSSMIQSRFFLDHSVKKKTTQLQCLHMFPGGPPPYIFCMCHCVALHYSFDESMFMIFLFEHHFLFIRAEFEYSTDQKKNRPVL
jgi:hypothetical protein